MNRRSFLRNTIAGTTAVAVTPAAFLASCGEVTAPKPTIGNVSGMQVPAPPFDNVFNTLDVNSAIGAAIEASKNYAILIGINGTFCYGYTDSVWGPTLKSTSGNSASITLTNSTTETSNLHFHGLTLDANLEDGIEGDVSDGGSKTYNFTVNDRAGLYWYHAHYQKTAGKQLNLGLGGLFLVEDNEEDVLNLPAGDQKSTTIVIQDKRFNEDNQMFYGPNIAERMAGYFGETILVNGIQGPFKNISTRIHRLRIANASTARIYNLSLNLSTGEEVPFTIIGGDCGLLKTTGGSVTQILLAPGERLDTLVDFSTLAAGTEVFINSRVFGGAGDYQGAAGFDIMKFVITNEEAETYSIPGSLSTIVDLTEGDVTGETRNMNISNDGISNDDALNNPDNMHGINGDAYDADVVNFTVNSGAIEKWVFDNSSGNEPRAMHVYGAQFQVLAREGGRGNVKIWERGWKDTVLMLPGEIVTIIIPFTVATGKYHVVCTNLEQADSGLINNFEII